MKKRQGGDTELLVFYSFNGNMEHDELVRQLRELAAQIGAATQDYTL